MKTRDAWVITIGDELLRGEIVDSNKSFFAERLLRLDVECSRHVTVADDPGAIREQLLAATESPRIIMISGGLGPTRDDITTEVVARTFERPLRRDAEVVERIRRYFESAGRTMAENNLKQADFPEGAEVLANPLGTAPGFMLPVRNSLIFCTPGVPRELYRMVDEEILPRIQARLGAGPVVRARLVRTFGLGESTLDRALRDVARDDPGLSLGFRTQFPDNLVRVVARADDPQTAEAKLARGLTQVRECLGTTVVSESDQQLEEVVESLLESRKVRLAIVETCTGGLVSHLLTEASSERGALVESICSPLAASLERVLGAGSESSPLTPEQISSLTRSLAETIRKQSGADLGLALSSSEETGIGDVVHLALAHDSGPTPVHSYALLRSRTRSRRLAAQIALEWLRRHLLGLELPESTFPRLESVPGLGKPEGNPHS